VTCACVCVCASVFLKLITVKVDFFVLMKIEFTLRLFACVCVCAFVYAYVRVYVSRLSFRKCGFLRTDECVSVYCLCGHAFFSVCVCARHARHFVKVEFYLMMIMMMRSPFLVTSTANGLCVFFLLLYPLNREHTRQKVFYTSFFSFLRFFYSYLYIYSVHPLLC